MKPRNLWAPYILILPSIAFLAFMFAWPMVQALRLAVWDSTGMLYLREDADLDSRLTGSLPQGANILVLERQGNLLPPEEIGQRNMLTENWFQVRGEGLDGSVLEGWASNARIRVREEAPDGTPIAGTVRRILLTDVDPNTDIYAEADEGSPIIGEMEPNTVVAILDTAILEVWYRIEAEYDGETVTGWSPSRYIQVFGDGENGRIDRGNTGVVTSRYINRMLNDRFFVPALTTTMLLIVTIIPLQFVMAVIMALVIQARLRGNDWFLYIFTIPLGLSDLAVGIIWFSIFTQYGYLNTILQQLGLITFPISFLSADNRIWIIIAITLAEIWRATSLVMVIVVSGLQAISDEVLEAAELFGATLWQRLWHIILPILKPSLQVALILRTILALQVFAVVIALGGGEVVTVLARETYRQYNLFRNPNVAATYAGFILLLSMVSSILYLKLVRSREEALE